MPPIDVNGPPAYSSVPSADRVSAHTVLVGRGAKTVSTAPVLWLSAASRLIARPPIEPKLPPT